MAAKKRKPTAYSKALKKAERKRGKMSRKERAAAIARSEKRRKRELTNEERRQVIERAERKRGRYSKEEREALKKSVREQVKREKVIKKVVKKSATKILKQIKSGSSYIPTPVDLGHGPMKNLIKQFNERIAKIGRTYGNDSIIYQKVIENVENILPPYLKLFVKITQGGKGFFAIDQTKETLDQIDNPQTETVLENAIYGLKSTSKDEEDIEGIPTLGEYNRGIDTMLERENSFADFSTEFQQTNEYKSGKDEIVALSNIKEAVKSFLEANPAAASPIINDLSEQGILHRRPTYWEWYRGIVRYTHGADSDAWKDITATTQEMYKPTKPQVPEELQREAQTLAQRNRVAAVKHGKNPYTKSKPNNPYSR